MRQGEKLYVAVCGPLPGAVALLERRGDVEYSTFSNGNELYDYAENEAPFDFMVIHSAAGEGMVPLYYYGSGGYCFVYLTADPQDDDGRDSLNELLDARLEDKRLQSARKEGSVS